MMLPGSWSKFWIFAVALLLALALAHKTDSHERGLGDGEDDDDDELVAELNGSGWLDWIQPTWPVDQVQAPSDDSMGDQSTNPVTDSSNSVDSDATNKAAKTINHDHLTTTTTTTSNPSNPPSTNYANGGSHDHSATNYVTSGLTSDITPINLEPQMNLSRYGNSTNVNVTGGLIAANFDESSYDKFITCIMITNTIIFAIGLSGNLMVIIVISKFTKIDSVTNIYILNLAFADLMFVLGLFFLITTMQNGNWMYGNAMCKMFLATTSLNQFASSFLLTIMSFDRFLAVCHPIYAQSFRQLKRAKVICAFVWLLCLILMTPIFLFAKTNEELTCGITWPDNYSFNCEVAFTLYSFCIGFALPLMLIGGFYYKVVMKLREATKNRANLGTSNRSSKFRQNSNKRIESLVIIIICTYTVCWFPYWITQLMVSFSRTNTSSPDFYFFVMIATSLSYTNSAVNPILYAFLSDNFKRRCGEVLSHVSVFRWFGRETAANRDVGRRQSSNNRRQQLNSNRRTKRTAVNQKVNFQPESQSADVTSLRLNNDHNNNNMPSAHSSHTLMVDVTPIRVIRTYSSSASAAEEGIQLLDNNPKTNYSNDNNNNYNTDQVSNTNNSEMINLNMSSISSTSTTEPKSSTLVNELRLPRKSGAKISTRLIYQKRPPFEQQQ